MMRRSLAAASDAVSEGSERAARCGRTIARGELAPSSSRAAPRRRPSRRGSRRGSCRSRTRCPSRPTSFATSRSRPLRSSFARPGGLDVARSRRRTRRGPGRAPAARRARQDVGRRLEREVGRAVLLLELAVGGLLRPEVGDGRGHHDRVGTRRASEHGGAHLLGGRRPVDRDARRRRDACRARARARRRRPAGPPRPRPRPPSCRSSGCR